VSGPWGDKKGYVSADKGVAGPEGKNQACFDISRRGKKKSQLIDVPTISETRAARAREGGKVSQERGMVLSDRWSKR